MTYDPAADAEGFRAASHQFDTDITDGRHPRAALGLSESRVLAVAVDGRSSTTPASRCSSSRA